MGTSIMHMVYPRRVEELRDEQRGLAWLDAIAGHGYCIVQEFGDFYPVYESALREHWPAHLSADTIASFQRFAAGQQDEFSCVAFSLQRDFHIQLGITYTEGFLLLHASDGDFRFGEYQERYEQWLALAELTYQIWHPIFAFDIFGHMSNFASRNEALALEADQLYMVNMYGPEFVEQLGRDRLLSAPAWRIKALDDGGIMLAPIPFREGDPFQPQPYSYKETARRLGLPS